ncbi:uncharacterized protein Bfra_003303, partial [Botrytis fragariae]
RARPTQSLQINDLPHESLYSRHSLVHPAPLGAYTTYNDISYFITLLLPQHVMPLPFIFRIISVTSLIGFIILLREPYFHFISVSRLRPPYYALSNLFRAIHVTFHLSVIFVTLQSDRTYRYAYFARARLIILLFLYCTALAYGSWTWYLLWRNRRDSSDNEDDEEGSTKPGMNLVPRKILSSSNLTSRNNFIIKTMLWIHAPLHVISNDPSSNFEERRVWGKLAVIVVWGSKVLEVSYMLLKVPLGRPLSYPYLRSFARNQTVSPYTHDFPANPRFKSHKIPAANGSTTVQN